MRRCVRGERMQQFRRRTAQVRSLVSCRASSARRVRGRAAHLAAATALTSALLPSRHVAAQTWAAPVSGSWSLPGNWLGGSVPVSDPATGLHFDASGTDSYNTFNNLASPFILGALELNPSTGSSIAIDGSPLNFAGAAPSISLLGNGAAAINNTVQLSTDTVIVGAGTGTITLQGAISSIPASTRSLINDAANGTVVLRGGATLYGLKADAGNTILNGGSYTTVSAQHGTDPFGSVADGGFWGMVAGDTVGQVGRLTITGGAVHNAQNGFVANPPNTAGIATFSGAGTTANFPTTGNEGRLGVNFGTGTINIVNGATVNARRVDLGRQDNSVGNLLVDGANSRL